MTREEAIEIIKCGDISNRWGKDGEEVEKMAIKALEQEPRNCKTCIHSDKGKCAGTEECHECMWESKYEQELCDDCISRQAVLDLMRGLTRWCVRSEDGKFNNVGLLYDDVMFGIDKLPSVTPQPIECEERKSGNCPFYAS